MDVKFEILLGKTLKSINKVLLDGGDCLRFTTDKGEVFESYHEQDCCESVSIEDINGDLEDLLNSPILQAEEVTKDGVETECGYTSTWTFYKLATIKGYVTIRWYGESNGYYSESVDFRQTK